MDRDFDNMSTHYMLGHHSKSPSQKFRPNELGSMNLNLSLFFILPYLGLNTHMYMSRNRNGKKKIEPLLRGEKKQASLTGEKPSRDITLGPLDGWKSTL